MVFIPILYYGVKIEINCKFNKFYRSTLGKFGFEAWKTRVYGIAGEPPQKNPLPNPLLQSLAAIFYPPFLKECGDMWSEQKCPSASLSSMIPSVVSVPTMMTVSSTVVSSTVIIIIGIIIGYVTTSQRC